MKCSIFLLFYNALDLNNQKTLRMPSIYQFDRTVTDLNHPGLCNLLSICIKRFHIHVPPTQKKVRQNDNHQNHMGGKIVPFM